MRTTIYGNQGPGSGRQLWKGCPNSLPLCSCFPPQGRVSSVFVGSGVRGLKQFFTDERGDQVFTGAPKWDCSPLHQPTESEVGNKFGQKLQGRMLGQRLQATS